MTPEKIITGHKPNCLCAYCQALKSHAKTKEEVQGERGEKDRDVEMMPESVFGPPITPPPLQLQTHTFTKKVTIDGTTYETIYSAQCGSPKEVEQAKERFLKLHYSYRDGKELAALKEGTMKPTDFTKDCSTHDFEAMSRPLCPTCGR